MRLREHPDIDAWPPQWHGTFSRLNRNAPGEIGILTGVKLMRASGKPAEGIVLLAEFGGIEFKGVVTSRDPLLLERLYRLLPSHYGESVRDVGELDV